ncbi:hypothetical protein T310_6061 [Rasamsonia emersonii CBS 393.64]|uniref:Uncharacterized protein n=1 Tax=Rasamsonia emersonii (strain ATCC 16479 / CBS 393.64 / IMI 116815) TaxID=1408163 RepID=A0A0F4YNV5_RASE3|nr:hypothetical protein T310_6061 [Rasamsonia emersonii CBS 393.64]KKA19947.1 hypothetical protein T310_6061 [Rasamsonia emersonii CBS 393.64]
MASAAIVVGLVLYDARSLAKRSLPTKTGKTPNLLHMVHPAEVVPLSLSMAILAQGVVFLSVQAIGVDTIMIQDCRAIGQLVFPAIWIVGFVVLVLGIETVYRSLRKDRFASRGRWNIIICWVAVAVMLLLTWIPTRARPRAHDRCRAILLVFALPWADVAFGITLALIILYLVMGAILVAQLLRTVKLDRTERIAASRMVFTSQYIDPLLTWQSFVIPLWGQVTFSRRSQVTFMMATIALNVFGIVNSFFHLLLRSNADSMAIRPPATSWQGNRKWKFFGSNALDIGHHITSPVALPDDSATVSRSSSKRDKSDVEAAGQSKPDANKSLPPPPLLTVPKHYQKRSQYSVFPTKESTRQLLRPLHPPSSIYEDDENLLRPPEAPFASHQRHSSGVSMATVQIGLRLSNVSIPAMRLSNQKFYRPASPLTLGPSGLREESIRLSAQSLDVPVTLRSPTSEPNSVPEIWVQKTEVTDDSTAKAKPSVKKPIDRSATMKDLPPHPPLEFKSNKTKQAEKVLESRPTTASSSAQTEQWPLRNSQDILLPKKAYRPNENSRDGWI